MQMNRVNSSTINIVVVIIIIIIWCAQAAAHHICLISWQPQWTCRSGSDSDLPTPIATNCSPLDLSLAIDVFYMPDPKLGMDYVPSSRIWWTTECSDAIFVWTCICYRVTVRVLLPVT